MSLTIPKGDSKIGRFNRVHIHTIFYNCLTVKGDTNEKDDEKRDEAS